MKALRRYPSEHAKTDLADAHVLAAIPGFGGPRLDPVHIPAPKSHALQHQNKQLGRLQVLVAAAKRRLLDMVRCAAPALERVLPDLRTELSLSLLQRWLDPDAVLAVRSSTMTGFIARHARGNHPQQRPLRRSARRRPAPRRARGRGHVDFADLRAEVAIEVDVIRSHIAAITSLERRIEALYAELQPQDALRSIPGIGRHLAPVLLGVLHTAERFRSQRHIRGFCGLFRRRADSGGTERPGQSITQGGDDRIKPALMLAADTARKIDPDLAAVYWRLMTTKGHHHKQALCAVANRLANRILCVQRSGRPYVLRDRDGREITVAEAKAMVKERHTVPHDIRTSRRANRLAASG